MIRSAGGVGVLSKNSALTSIAQKPFGAYLSRWLLRSTDDFAAVADFDGDGADEILVHASSGRTGISAVSPFGYIYMQRTWDSGARIGGWRLSSTDTIEGDEWTCRVGADDGEDLRHPRH